MTFLGGGGGLQGEAIWRKVLVCVLTVEQVRFIYIYLLIFLLLWGGGHSHTICYSVYKVPSISIFIS